MTVIGDDVNQTEEHFFPDQRCQRPPMGVGTAVRRLHYKA